MSRLILLAIASLGSASAIAGSTGATPVSEPGILGLFAAAGVALFVLKKFKK